MREGMCNFHFLFADTYILHFHTMVSIVITIGCLLFVLIVAWLFVPSIVWSSLLVFCSCTIGHLTIGCLFLLLFGCLFVLLICHHSWLFLYQWSAHFWLFVLIVVFVVCSYCCLVITVGSLLFGCLFLYHWLAHYWLFVVIVVFVICSYCYLVITVGCLFVLFVVVPLVSSLLVVCSYPHSSRLSGRLQSESNQGRGKKSSNDNDENANDDIGIYKQVIQ